MTRGQSWQRLNRTVGLCGSVVAWWLLGRFADGVPAGGRSLISISSKTTAPVSPLRWGASGISVGTPIIFLECLRVRVGVRRCLPLARHHRLRHLRYRAEWFKGCQDHVRHQTLTKHGHVLTVSYESLRTHLLRFSAASLWRIQRSYHFLLYANSGTFQIN